jgi:hypothetical protein
MDVDFEVEPQEPSGTTMEVVLSLELKAAAWSLRALAAVHGSEHEETVSQISWSERTLQTPSLVRTRKLSMPCFTCENEVQVEF